MYFITNRALKQSERSRFNRTIDFDLDATGSLASIYFCRRRSIGNYTEILSKNLLEEVRTSEFQEIILFIHGYNVLPEGPKYDGQKGVFETAASLQELFNGVKDKHYLVLPLVWPTDNDPGMLKDYFDDRLTADASGSPFARVLAKFLLWRAAQPDGQGCFKRISVITHSMGALVLYSTLTKWAMLHGAAPRIFRNIFLFAADTPNEILHREHPGRVVADSAGTVSVYHAADDLAMRASKVANLSRVVSRRLGHTGPEDMDKVPSNVTSIDCSDFNTEYDPLEGHGYFLYNIRQQPGAAFKHMAYTLVKKRPDRAAPIEPRPPSTQALYLPEIYTNSLFA